MTKLNVSPTVKAQPSSQKDHQLPHNDSRRPFSVTPHIAVTTAAALNAERSAQKLKKALLAARKAPLLNDKAAQVPPARITFKTPKKITLPDRAESTFKSPAGGPLFSAEVPQTPALEWSFPEDNFNPSPSPPTRRGAGRTKKHASNAPLKKSVGSAQAPQPSFDWGPLPGFSQPALASVGPPVSLAPKIPPGFVPLTQSKR
jgi:nucleoporin NUP159